MLNASIRKLMKKAFQIIAVVALFFLSAGVFLDPYVCGDRNTQSKSAPADCCVICCPAHNLVPTSNSIVQTFPVFTFGTLAPDTISPYMALITDSIFRPPRA